MIIESAQTSPPDSGSANPKSLPQREHVAGPAEDRDQVARVEAADVVVPRHLADLPVVHVRLEDLEASGRTARP